MFHRQYFNKSSQDGLLPDAITFENSLRCNNMTAAWKNLEALQASASRGYVKRQYRRLLHISTHNKQLLRISNDGFWPGFKLDQTQFWHYISEACASLSLVPIFEADPAKADVIFISCFNLSQQFIPRHQTIVLYLGENVRPHYTYCDYSLTCDDFNYRGRNTFFPVWLTSLSGSVPVSYAPTFTSVVDFVYLKHRELMLPFDSRRDVIVHVGNNKEPLRTSIIQDLLDRGYRVEVYGSQTRPIDSKFRLYGSSKYILCPENSFFPSYTSEKLVECLFSGAKALFWGAVPTNLANLVGDSIYNLSSAVGYDQFLEVNMNAHQDSLRISGLAYQYFRRQTISIEKSLQSFFSVVFTPYSTI